MHLGARLLELRQLAPRRAREGEQPLVHAARQGRRRDARAAAEALQRLPLVELPLQLLRVRLGAAGAGRPRPLRRRAVMDSMPSPGGPLSAPCVTCPCELLCECAFRVSLPRSERVAVCLAVRALKT